MEISVTAVVTTQIQQCGKKHAKIDGSKTSKLFKKSILLADV